MRFFIDDEIFCRFLVELLEDVSFDAFSMDDGRAAYQSINDENCDLAIVDVRIPLLLEAEMAERPQVSKPQLKIILPNAFANHALKEYARRRGILLLSKPFARVQPLDALNLALGEAIGKN